MFACHPLIQIFFGPLLFIIALLNTIALTCEINLSNAYFVTLLKKNLICSNYEFLGHILEVKLFELGEGGAAALKKGQDVGVVLVREVEGLVKAWQLFAALQEKTVEAGAGGFGV